MTDITKLDLYELFSVNETCSTQEITSAFRRTALKCHPDKYPNDNEKKEQFILIKRALELLTDEQARKAYDAFRKQKKVQEERLSQMDATRKKFKEDLERNEQKATNTNQSTLNKPNSERLRAEIERLRREGNRLVDEELEKLQTIVETDKNVSKHIVVVVKYFPKLGKYTDNELEEIFNKYGNISTIVNGNSKSALIEFNENHISKMIENEKGFSDRPFASVNIKGQTKTTQKQNNDTIDLTKPDFEDFEAMILRKMSQQTTNS